MKQTLLNKIEERYAAIGGERGALSEFARDIKTDPRVVHQWQRKRGGVIPSIWGDLVEKATDGQVTKDQVVAEDIAFMIARRDTRAANRKRLKAQGKKSLREQRV